MPKASAMPLLKIFRLLIAFLPWVLSMYSLYWLEYGGIWTTETPHRGKISVMILSTGMLVSFLVHSYWLRREQEKKRGD
jgi:hypothetical protein